MTTTATAAEIRQWAREQGIAVGDRGRLHPTVIAAYMAAAGLPRSSGGERAHHSPGLRTQRGEAELRLEPRPAVGVTGVSRTVRALHGHTK